MNPPVDAPASRHSRPAGSSPNAARAFSSFCPPRDTIARALGDLDGHVVGDHLARLLGAAALVAQADVAGQDRGGGPGARLEQPPLRQDGVEPLA